MQQSRFRARPPALLLALLAAVSCSDSGTEPEPEIERRIVFTTPPATSAQNRSVLPTQPVLQLRDDQGRLVAEAGRVVTASIESGAGKLTGDSIVSTDPSGRATFSDLGIQGTIGEYTIRFTLSVAAVRYSITAPVSLEAGPAATVTVSSATVLSGQEGADLQALPRVRVTDADGNPVAGVTVTFESPSGGVVSGASQVTNEAGEAALGRWTLDRYPATYTIAARAEGVPGPAVMFTVRGTVHSFEQFAGGELHTCAITVSGAAFCWGHNGTGALGDGTGIDRLAPVEVKNRPVYRVITAGFAHTCALAPTGQAYCWGMNRFGQLGDGTKLDRFEPTPVAGGITFDTLVAGYLHTCGIASSRATYCWGINEEGALGDNSTMERLVPSPVVGGHQFRALAGGGKHTCGIRTDGRVLCWGGNEYGQLGDGTNQSRLAPVEITGGMTFESLTTRLFHTCAVRAGGGAYCWGRNTYAQLGDGTAIDRSTPVPVTGNRSFGVLTAGNDHTCGLSTTGSVFCWGANGALALGDGTSIDRPTPVPLFGGLTYRVVHAGAAHGCAQPTASGPRCWGYNTRGQLGIGSTDSYAEPQPIVIP
jgi:hypothetical protein